MIRGNSSALVIRQAVLLCCALIAAGCQPPGPSGPAATAAAQMHTADHEAGRKIYNFRCYYCHGYSGDAKTLAATYLSPQPLDFTASSASALSRPRMLESIRDGRPGTAMAGFHGILTPREIEWVADFVHEEFMIRKAVNTRYHTAETGWPAHERYRDAYPFATGTVAVDIPWEQLNAQQAAGKRLYLATCVSCHDRGRASEDRVLWELRAVSYPRNQDSCSTCHSADGQLRPSASHMVKSPYSSDGPRLHPEIHANFKGPHAVHDVSPSVAGLNAQERHGESIYQKNCAFCHAADGTGRNWIGAFLEPHPRDLTDPQAMAGLTPEKLVSAISDGVPGTSMPAWKSVLQDKDIAAVASYIHRVFYKDKRSTKSNNN